MNVRLAENADLELLILTLRELRPHLAKDAMLKSLIHQFEQGYRLAFIGNQKQVYAVVGFRTLNFLFSGKTLYIDDMVTHPAYRKQGYAGRLLEWIKDFAKDNE